MSCESVVLCVAAALCTQIIAASLGYEGQLKDGARNGWGRMRYPKGVYEGQLVNDERHGMGTWWHNSGVVYGGQWKYSMMNGHGTYRYPDGAVYAGGFVNDKRCGYGSYHDCPRTQMQSKACGNRDHEF